MNILVFSPGYPDAKVSNYPFIKQLVEEWAKKGNSCTVITTNSITKNKRFVETATAESFDGGGSVKVFRSNVLSFSKYKILGVNLTSLFHKWGVKKALRKVKDNVDVVYCHFWQSGADGFLYTKKKRTPMIIASGESNIELLFGDTDKSFVDFVSGVVCVSSKNMEESVRLGLTTLDKCEVFPNCVNPSLFRKLNKLECRKKLGLPENVFIVIFVGSFKESKGPLRLEQALRNTNDNNIYSVYIGGGAQLPSPPNMLYRGQVMHEDIPLFLNASDVFVLPTLAEGCCNAIIEAMACGLPIISSDLPFNWDVLDSSNSILIDPSSITQISEAIIKVKDDKSLRERLSEGALKTAQSLTIDRRASNILSFIKKRCEKIDNKLNY